MQMLLSCFRNNWPRVLVGDSLALEIAESGIMTWRAAMRIALDDPSAANSKRGPGGPRFLTVL